MLNKFVQCVLKKRKVLHTNSIFRNILAPAHELACYCVMMHSDQTLLSLKTTFCFHFSLARDCSVLKKNTFKF